MDAAKGAVYLQSLFDERFGSLDLAFLDERSGDIEPAVGVAWLGFGDFGEGVLGSLEVALQEHADAPIVPAFAVLFADHGLPVLWCLAVGELQTGFGLGERHDREVGDA